MGAQDRPTAAQLWALQAGERGVVLGGYGGRSVIQSFHTGEVRYGCRHETLFRCKANGWIGEDGRTTDLGRAAIAKAEGA